MADKLTPWIHDYLTDIYQRLGANYFSEKLATKSKKVQLLAVRYLPLTCNIFNLIRNSFVAPSLHLVMSMMAITYGRMCLTKLLQFPWCSLQWQYYHTNSGAYHPVLL